MALKRVLGMMLASRLAGRGRRRGGLGAAGLLGGLGYRRRRGLGGKLGLASLGYMAYRAYQDHQKRTAGASSGATSGAGATSGGSSGGIGGMIQDAADRLTGGGASSSGGAQPEPRGAEPEPDLSEDEAAAERVSDDEALLLIRAMIAAAHADGVLSEDERAGIMGQIDEAGADEADRRVMEREIADPKPVDELLAQVRDEETAQRFYLASCAAVDPETERNRAYLSDLRRRLGLSEEEAAEVEELTA